MVHNDAFTVLDDATVAHILSYCSTPDLSVKLTCKRFYRLGQPFLSLRKISKKICCICELPFYVFFNTLFEYTLYQQNRPHNYFMIACLGKHDFYLAHQHHGEEAIRRFAKSVGADFVYETTHYTEVLLDGCFSLRSCGDKNTVSCGDKNEDLNKRIIELLPSNPYKSDMFERCLLCDKPLKDSYINIAGTTPRDTKRIPVIYDLLRVRKSQPTSRGRDEEWRAVHRACLFEHKRTCGDIRCVWTIDVKTTYHHILTRRLNFF